MIENRQNGIFNATGPDYPLTLGELLTTCREVTHSNAAFTWVSDQFLLDQHVIPYTELPLWLPRADAAWDSVSISCALSLGLKFRPLAKTVASTWLWDQTRPLNTPRRNGLAPERETALLQAWHKQGAYFAT